jgi:hypothetical protein
MLFPTIQFAVFFPTVLAVQSIPPEIDARVRCRNHGRRVIQTYQQDT